MTIVLQRKLLFEEYFISIQAIFSNLYFSEIHGRGQFKNQHVNSPATFSSPLLAQVSPMRKVHACRIIDSFITVQLNFSQNQALLSIGSRVVAFLQGFL